jgi:ABC-2 type transport system ATP-binding protein
MMTQPLISVRNATKSYGNFTLGPVDFDIEPGYVVGVVGPNGSGKTTLFRMLLNLANPDDGEIELFDRSHPEHEVEIKQRIGYAPESPVGYEEMRPETLGRFVSYWYPRWNQKRYDELLWESDIPKNKPFGTLSKGQQRRVVFALARATEADLLLLDEPTAGVDPFARREMMGEISRYMQDGERTVLMATHVMEEVRRICDYILLVCDGRYLGLYEKDALVEQWRSLWVDRAPEGPLPGLVRVERGTPIRLITNGLHETNAALVQDGIRIVRSGPVDLEEILDYLMHSRASV